MVLGVDGFRIVGNVAAGDFGESHGKRLLVRGLGDFDGGLQLDGAIALATHHVVDVMSALRCQGAQQEAVVIGSDTVVVLDGKILGKPHSEQEACEMLRSLSGRTHKVFTGVAIVCGGKVKNFFDETDVEFYSLGDDEIKKYVATGEPTDKAGAYGIQGKGSVLVKRINGDFFSVMGLPIAKLYREMSDFV